MHILCNRLCILYKSIKYKVQNQAKLCVKTKSLVLKITKILKLIMKKQININRYD